MPRSTISTPDAPTPLGAYSQAVSSKGMLYISGVVGSDPKTGELRQGFAAQVEQALMNVGAVLAAVHLDFGDVVKTTVLLTDIAHLGQVNECYRRFFNEPMPARLCYQVVHLPMSGLVEIEAIAEEH